MIDRIPLIENYVRQTMSTVTAPDLRIAHDFKHVDRVRRWALHIARGEGGYDLILVEAAALLHDIGLSRIKVDQRHQHAPVGAEMTAQFLQEHDLFERADIDLIVQAIRCHSSPDGGGPLGLLLRDADKLDALGAVGIMRAFTSKYAKPDYDPHNVKGETWGLPMTGFEARFAQGQGIGPHIIDQINFQISFYTDLHTETAKQFGKPLVEVMQTFILQLEFEICRAHVSQNLHRLQENDSVAS